MVHYCVDRNPLLDSILSLLNSVHIFISCFLMIHFNSIILSILCLQSGLFRLAAMNLDVTLCFSYMLCFYIILLDLIILFITYLKI
jgi:hypothetical protein